MDTCIALRTMVVCDGKVFIQAGAGLVADSDPTLRISRDPKQGSRHDASHRSYRRTRVVVVPLRELFSFQLKELEHRIGNLGSRFLRDRLSHSLIELPLEYFLGLSAMEVGGLLLRAAHRSDHLSEEGFVRRSRGTPLAAALFLLQAIRSTSIEEGFPLDESS